MKNRSGLTAYLKQQIKIAEPDSNNVIDKKINLDVNSPVIFTKCPQIKDTCKNYIKTTRGNLPIPAIIDKIRSIHQRDVSNASDWEDDKLIRHISRLNLEEKSKNHGLENE